MRGGRRAFLRRVIKVLAALWAGGLATASLSYLRLPQSLEPLSGGAVAVGPLDELQPGRGRLVTGAHRPFWIIRTDSGEAVALSAVCTHRRCILKFVPQAGRLECPCHGGAFDLNGNVLFGPPPRPLESLSVSIKGGRVYVYV